MRRTWQQFALHGYPVSGYLFFSFHDYAGDVQNMRYSTSHPSRTYQRRHFPGSLQIQYGCAPCCVGHGPGIQKVALPPALFNFSLRR
jgi:hypothetical protein